MPNPSEPYGLSPIQQGILFYALGAPGLGAYNSQTIQEIDGDLDPARLERAWAAVAARHDAFRTEFLLDGDVAMQRVVPAVPLPFTRIDVSTASEGVIEREVEAVTAAWTKDFDLRRAPLFRIHLVKLPAGRWLHVIDFHHLVMDGWSWELVLEDLWTAYIADREGRPIELPPGPSYREYVAWMATQDVTRAERTLRARLAGLAAVTPLPTTTPATVPPASPFAHRAEQRSTIDVELTKALREAARRAGCSLAALVAGAWGLALGRTTGVDDVVFGMTLAGRRAKVAGVSELVGVLVNTLPLRLSIAGGQERDAWLGEVGARLLELVQHETTPLARVQEWSPFGRGVSLYETSIVFQNQISRRDPAELDRRRGFRVLETEDGLEHDAIMLVITPTARGTITVQARHDASRVSGPELGRMITRFTTALEALARPAGTPTTLRALDLVTPKERRQLAARRPAARPHPDAPATLHEAFERQVDRTPDAIALVQDDVRLTYRQLDRRANALAARLVAQGVGPEVRVALVADRSIERVIAACAILKAGGAIVPLAPALSPAKVSYFVADAGARLVVSAADVTADEADRGPRRAGPRHLAYALYGPSGPVRAAANEHAAVVNRILASQGEVPLGAEHAVLHKSPGHFDLAFWEVFWPLAAGARVVVARPGGDSDPAYLVGLIRARGVTTVHFVPSMLDVFLDEPGLAELSSLTYVVASGEPLDGEVVRKLHVRLPHTRLDVSFGPAECAIDVTAARCPTTPFAGPAPIGRPVANVDLYVLDRDLGETFPEVAGELFVGGAAVGRGYLGRPDATAERFLPDPFATAPGARLFRSGERACWREDGTLAHLGKVAPPRTTAATRTPTDAKPGGRLLVAGKAFSGADVGKGGAATAATTRGFVAPSGELERTLAEVWAQVLGIERVGAEDNFFAIGGDSIRSIQVASRARPRGLQLTSAEVFANPTIRALARIARPIEGVVPAEQGVLQGVCPLTPIVHWFLGDAPSAHFNQAVLLTPSTRVGAAALARAADAVVTHHDALRLRLLRPAGRPPELQLAAPATGQAPLEVVELSAHADADLAAAIERHGSRVQASLELEHGPIVRVVLFELGAGRGQRVLLVAHHLAVDATSWGVIVADLGAALDAVVADRRIDLPAKTTSVRAWAAALEAEARRLEADAATWSALALTPVPRFEPPVRVATPTLATIVRRAPAPLAQHRRPEEVVLAAVTETITRWAGVERLLVDVEGHGRDPLGGHDVARTVGWFTTITPVVVTRGASFDATVTAAAAALAPARAAPHTFGLLRYLGGEATRARFTGWVDAPILFTFLGTPFGADGAGAFTIAAEPTGAAEGADRRSRYLMVVNVGRTATGVEVELISTTVPAAELERLAEDVLTRLGAPPPETAPRPEDFPLAGLSAEELARVLGATST